MSVTFEHTIVDAHGPLDPHTKAVGDITGSGADDLVVPSSKDGPLVWYEAPEWTRHEIAPSGRWSCDAKLVDVDGDGDLDIVVSDWYGNARLEWYENPRPNGDPRTDPWELHIIGEPRAHDICAGDIDGDGRLNLVTRQQGEPGNQFVLWARVAEQAWRSSAIPCPAGEGLALADIDGDGRLDVVLPGRWYRAPADIWSDPWEEHAYGHWPEDGVVRVHDMSGNGRPDVVLTRSEGKHHLSWFEAPGDPTTSGWREHVVEPSLDFAHSLQVADLTGNGLPDIVTAEMHQSERRRVMVYLNGGSSASWDRQTLATTGSHNIGLARAADGGLSIFGANWSGDYQPVEMWRVGSG